MWKGLRAMGLDHAMMPPAGHGGPSGRGATFLGVCARFMRAYMLCQFNAIQRVLAHVMNNIIR